MSCAKAVLFEVARSRSGSVMWHVRRVWQLSGTSQRTHEHEKTIVCNVLENPALSTVGFSLRPETIDDKKRTSLDTDSFLRRFFVFDGKSRNMDRGLTYPKKVLQSHTLGCLRQFLTQPFVVGERVTLLNGGSKVRVNSPASFYLNRPKLASTRLCDNHIIIPLPCLLT